SIYMNFNTVMNHESVENGFSIYPPTIGEFEWHRVNIKDSQRAQDRLRFKPEGYFKTQTHYTIELDTTVKDTNGIALYEPVSFSFTTEELKIKWTYPDDGWTDVSTGSSVVIYFNSAMSETATEKAFYINPETQGSFDWSGGQLRFNPEKVLGSDKLYTITIDTSAQSIEGVRLKENYSFSFTTSEIQVISSFPADGANYVSPEANVQITFSTDMDQLSVVNTFTMFDSDSTEVNGEFSWSDLNKLTFNPDLALALNEEYTVIIRTDASDIRGVNMPEEFVLWFKTRP
ncbi:MAG: Ig-like domain-containing protein, partial [Candidatus Zixiibacteriota bacterium]